MVIEEVIEHLQIMQKLYPRAEVVLHDDDGFKVDWISDGIDDNDERVIVISD